MKRDKRKYIKLLLIIAFIALVPILINGFMTISTPITQGKVSDWIAFYGGYIGAIVGGIVAFIVAKIQIAAGEKQVQENRAIAELPVYVIISDEIEKARKDIDYATDLFSDVQLELYKQALKKSCNKSMQNEELFLRTSMEMEYDDDSFIQYLDRLIDAKIIRQTIVFREQYNALKKSLSQDLQGVYNEINEKKLKLDELNNSVVLSESQQDQKRQLSLLLIDLEIVYAKASNERMYIVNQLRNGYYVSLVKELDVVVAEKISEIEKIAYRRNSYPSPHPPAKQ